MGHLPAGFGAAVHRCCTPSHHNWLPCMVGPTFRAIFSKRSGGRAPESRKPLPQNRFWGLQGHANTKPPGRSGITPLPFHMDGRQARFCLRSAESGIDRVIGQGILKVRQFLSCTRTRPRRSRAPGHQQSSSNHCPPTPPASDPASLAASQLSWAQQWVLQDDPRRPATISTRANCKINALWVQQWQSSAKSPPNPDLVEAPLGTDVLKLHEGLRKAQISLAIQLRMGTNGLDAFLFQARVPSVPSPLCSCGRGQQRAKHVLIFCPKYEGARHELWDEQGHLPDFSKLLGTAEGLRKTIRWVIQRGILGQFRGARDTLYGPHLPHSPAPD
jgi:hypothetical protein